MNLLNNKNKEKSKSIFEKYKISFNKEKIIKSIRQKIKIINLGNCK